MADKIIVVKEKRGGYCGIFSLIVLAIVGFCLYSCYSVIKDTDKKMRQEEASMTPEERAQRDLDAIMARPSTYEIQLMFRKSLKDYLNDPDSYKPGDIRSGSHPKGYAFVHEYRAKNHFGALVKSSCGLLCTTNSGVRAWTFYDPDALPTLLKDVSPTN